MEVLQLVSAPFAVNVYVVREQGRALVVDTSSGMDWAAFAPKVQAALAGHEVVGVYLTHLHVDHVGGAARMARVTGAPLLMHEDEAFAVETGDPTLTGASLFGGTMEAHPVTTLREGARVELGRRRFEVLLTPGHSPAHTVLWEPESRTLLCGDVAFAGGSFGRVDLPGGDGRALVRSLERLAALDADDLYPGHMEAVVGGAKDALLESLDNARLMLL